MDKTAFEIRSIVRERGITALGHFTPAANLQGILTHGLLSIDTLNEHDLSYSYTDGWRNDGRPHAVSLTIHDINRSMFARKLKDSRCDWVILEVDASVLWTHWCLFSWVNAASSEITGHRGRRDGPWAFKRMFDDCPVNGMDKRSSRAVFNTPDNMPTMNDAEVQVLNPIAPDLIRDVTIASERHRPATEAAMKAAGREIPIVVFPDIFRRR